MKEIKEKKRNIFLKKLISYFKKFSIFFVLFQLIMIVILVSFYYSSQLNHKYSVKSLFGKINTAQKKATGLDVNLIDEYFIALLTGLKTNFFGNELETINLFIDKKNSQIIEQQRLIKNKKLKSDSEITKKLIKLK